MRNLRVAPSEQHNRIDTDDVAESLGLRRGDDSARRESGAAEVDRLAERIPELLARLEDFADSKRSHSRIVGDLGRRVDEIRRRLADAERLLETATEQTDEVSVACATAMRPIFKRELGRLEPRHKSAMEARITDQATLRQEFNLIRSDLGILRDRWGSWSHLTAFEALRDAAVRAGIA